MKFEDFFKDVQYFTDGSYVVSGYYDKDVALKMIEKEIGETIEAHEIRSDYVRFGFAPDFVEGHEDFDGPIWYSGAWGNGAKPIWRYLPHA